MKSQSSEKAFLKGNKQILLAIVFVILLLPMISASFQYFQTRNNLGNGTITNRLTLGYSKGGYGLSNDNDYVSGNNPFETYIQYSVYVKTFNNANPNFKVDYCNLKIQYWGKLNNNPTTIFEKNFTDKDSDTSKAQYFFQLFDGDQAIAQETCYYQNLSFNQLLMPMEMQMVTPTNQCKSCQYYEWTKQEADVLKTASVGDNIVKIANYIYQIVIINFEIILALFWIFLILVLFLGVGLIFTGIFWLYIYLNRVIK